MAPDFRDGGAAARGGLSRLSARERQVLTGLAGGKPGVDIAAEPKVDANTVSTYEARLVDKLGQGSPSELVRCALGHGLVD